MKAGAGDGEGENEDQIIGNMKPKTNGEGDESEKRQEKRTAEP